MAAQRRQYLEWRRAATILQSMWRAKQARVQLRTAQQSVVLLQSTYRALSARRRKVAAVGALKKLQSAVRMWLGRSSYLRERCVDCLETTCCPLFLASSIANSETGSHDSRQHARCSSGGLAGSRHEDDTCRMHKTCGSCRQWRGVLLPAAHAHEQVRLLCGSSVRRGCI